MSIDLAAELRDLRARVATVAERVDTRDADAALQVAVAFRTLLAASTAGDYVALVRLHDAFPASPMIRTPEDRASEVAAEIGLAYGCSWGSARHRMFRAEQYAAVPALMAALRAGEVDTWQAWTLIERTRHLSDADRVEVADRLLTRHRDTEGGLTGPQWSRLLGRTVLGVDPTGGEARARQARADRDAWHRALDEATGRIDLTGPLHLTTRAWAQIDAAARAAYQVGRAGGGADRRSLAQFRFDLACAWLRNGGFGEPAEPEQPDPRRPWTSDTAVAGRVGPVPTVVNVTVPLSTLLHLDDAPGELAGVDAIPASVARDLAATATVWRRLLTDPTDGHLVTQDIKVYRPTASQRRFVLARHDWGSASRGATTRTGLQLDHDVPHDAACPTSALNLVPLDEASHQRKTDRRWQHRYHGDTGTLTQTSALGRTYRGGPLEPVGPTGTRAGPVSQPSRLVECRHDEPPDWLEEPTDATARSSLRC